MRAAFESSSQAGRRLSDRFLNLHHGHMFDLLCILDRSGEKGWKLSMGCKRLWRRVRPLKFIKDPERPFEPLTMPFKAVEGPSQDLKRLISSQWEMKQDTQENKEEEADFWPHKGQCTEVESFAH